MYKSYIEYNGSIITMYENSKELIVLVSQQCIYNINMNVNKYKKIL